MNSASTPAAQLIHWMLDSKAQRKAVYLPGTLAGPILPLRRPRESSQHRGIRLLTRTFSYVPRYARIRSETLTRPVVLDQSHNAWREHLAGYRDARAVPVILVPRTLRNRHKAERSPDSHASRRGTIYS